MSNQIIQQLIQDGSDDKNPTLQENAEAEPEEPNIIKEEDEIDNEEEHKDEIVVQEEMNELTYESLETISDPIVEECHPDIELKEEEDKNINFKNADIARYKKVPLMEEKHLVTLSRQLVSEQKAVLTKVLNLCNDIVKQQSKLDLKVDQLLCDYWDPHATTQNG